MEGTRGICVCLGRNVLIFLDSTPLDIAASYGYTECLTVLLDRGAIIDGTSVRSLIHVYYI